MCAKGPVEGKGRVEYCTYVFIPIEFPVFPKKLFSHNFLIFSTQARQFSPFLREGKVLHSHLSFYLGFSFGRLNFISASREQHISQEMNPTVGGARTVILMHNWRCAE